MPVRFLDVTLFSVRLLQFPDAATPLYGLSGRFSLESLTDFPLGPSSSGYSFGE